MLWIQSRKNIPLLIPHQGSIYDLSFGGEVLSGRRRQASSKGLHPAPPPPPRNFFEMNMHWDAIWCILRHNFEKCYSVCTNLVASWWFFRYSYLYTVMITIFFLGGGGSWAFCGGSFYPSNTLDRTLHIKRYKSHNLQYRLDLFWGCIKHVWEQISTRARRR